jgi:hypothetical protein
MADAAAEAESASHGVENDEFGSGAEQDVDDAGPEENDQMGSDEEEEDPDIWARKAGGNWNYFEDFKAQNMDFINFFRSEEDLDVDEDDARGKFFFVFPKKTYP